MSDKIYSVLSDGDTFDGVGGTEVILVASRFPDPVDPDGMNDLIAQIGPSNVFAIHLDELVGDICAVATGVIPRELFQERINRLLGDVKAYLEDTK